MGDSVPARAWLARLRAQADNGKAVNLTIAVFSMSLGMREEAIEALQRAVSSSEGTLSNRWIALHDPIFAPLRDDRHFQRLWEQARPRVPWGS
jgi:hypothetical protein